MALAGDKPVSQVARELEMSEKTLHNWLRLHREKNGEAVATDLDTSVEAELKRLRKENAQLKKERDILLCLHSLREKRRRRSSQKKLTEVRLDQRA